MEQNAGWDTALTPDLVAFIHAQTSVFLGTANAQGQPYIQHRGGPAGSCTMFDERTIAFADFAATANTSRPGISRRIPSAHLFLIDYAIAGGSRSGVKRESWKVMPR